MANKLTPKQENFCIEYIETGNASEAYRQAYDAENMKPETINRNAKALLDNNKIATRVEGLQAEHRERHNVTVDSLTSEYEEARTQAIKENQNSAAVAATTGKAKLHGLIIDKGKMEISGELTVRALMEAVDGRTRGIPESG